MITKMQDAVSKVMEMAKEKGINITETDAARIVRAGNSLSKKKAEIKRGHHGRTH